MAFIFKQNIKALIYVGLFIALLSFFLVKIAPVKEVVIIDSGVQQPELLLKGLKRDADIHYLIATKNPIEQISAILKEYRFIKNLHLISHGETGALLLADQIYNVNTIQDHKAQLSQWHQAFVKEGNVFLYGCDLAGTVSGKLFVDTLSQLTALKLFASDDLTGSQALLADAEFEYSP